MKSNFIVFKSMVIIALATFVSSCDSPPQEPVSEKKVKENIGDEQQESQTPKFFIKTGQKAFGSPIASWHDNKKHLVQHYRNNGPDLPVQLGGGTSRMHGMAISMKDINSMQKSANTAKKTLHSIYLMPYVINTSGEAISFIVAPVYAANIDEDLSNGIVQVGANQAYNSYSLCPDDCPQIDWDNNSSTEEISDRDAHKKD